MKKERRFYKERIIDGKVYPTCEKSRLHKVHFKNGQYHCLECRGKGVTFVSLEAHFNFRDLGLSEI